MSDGAEENPDRAAILERRKHFVARSLAEVVGPTACPSNRRTKALALALSGLATACPCLKIATDSGAPEDPEPTEDETATAGGDSDSDSGSDDGQPPQLAPER
jgi:hypothetical protein